MHYRIVLFITLSLTICTHLYTQSDSAEWAPIGTTWYYNFNSSNVYPQANALKMESIKDTMVNEKPARIIEGTIYYHSGDTLHAPDVFPEGRIILHQQGDSIYYLRENTFELLYDFSLEEGDTMNIVTPEPYRPNIENDTMIQVVIDSTGERVLDGDTLRTQIVSTNYSRFYTSYQMYGEIIEKIGNQEFLLPNYNGVCDAYCPFSLRCYQDSTIFYKPVDIACDTAYLLSSSESEPKAPDIRLYPNPVPQGYAQVYIDGTESHIQETWEWMLRDVQGRTLFHTDEISGESALSLPAGLSAGMYFIEIRSGNDRFVRKLVVQ